ncbi:17538_t:CDS:2 [Acaulospora morrowiae]|uniref:17538_t:CDS:1 n=1 Tax=Acaulospora morrowiae TaxID=94023 RepID=A0A9N9F7Z8_9GLOM|nr:17538_t:CDS:2 [Acaulospora morrowiae]
MSHWENDRSVCLLPIPQFNLFTERKRDVKIYLSGALFAVGWWFFIDAAVLSSTKKDLPEDSPVISFADWLCGIFSTLGMIIVCFINKSHLVADDITYTGSGVATRARTLLFIGFALMAGGLAGSMTLLILKHVVSEYETYIYFGIAVVVQNFLIMLSSALLWIARDTDNEYSYTEFHL